MSANSKAKAHHKKQLKRSKEYRKLLGINIPNRTQNPKQVVGELWYIVYEKSLVTPKLFKYSFVSDYFAFIFAYKHLRDIPHYVIKGQELIRLGIDKTQIRLKYASNHGRPTLPYKYDFPDGLSLQRKKTLRTMYRRNLRRLTHKLLKKKNKKTMDIYVKKAIDEKPGKFFKKMRKQWFYELTYSVTFKDWYVREESWRIDEITKEAQNFPKFASEIANILIALEEHYSDDKYDYKNDTYVSIAIYIWKTYKDRINKYMTKKGYVPKLSIHHAEEAWRELVYRGFIPHSLLPIPFDKKKDMYIACFASGIDLVYPKKVNKAEELYILQQRFGVIGFTGANNGQFK